MKFFENIRRKVFGRHINREIYLKIFPHLNGQANHGYPFKSDDEMVRLHLHGNLATHGILRKIELAAGKMPRAEGDAFRYIAYRDLFERMEMYLEFAETRRHDPTPDDYRFAAKAIQGA